MPESGHVGPDAGDVIWIDFGEPVGHEQGGRRPALVVTPREYNANSSVLVVCPISRRAREWPFNISLPQLDPVSGFVLVDQITVVDPKARPIRRAGRVPAETMAEVRGKLAVLLAIPTVTANPTPTEI
jgi:mRNA interferase MazF